MSLRARNCRGGATSITSPLAESAAVGPTSASCARRKLAEVTGASAGVSSLRQQQDVDERQPANPIRANSKKGRRTTLGATVPKLASIARNGTCQRVPPARRYGLAGEHREGCQKALPASDGRPLRTSPMHQKQRHCESQRTKSSAAGRSGKSHGFAANETTVGGCVASSNRPDGYGFTPSTP